MMHHNTEFGNKMFGGLDNIIWINIDSLILGCDLDLEGNNPLFPQDALAYDNLSSDQVGCQRISSSEDIVVRVIIDNMSPRCDLDLEDSKQFLFRMTLAHSAASPYHVW